MYDKKKKTSNVRSVHLLDRKRNIHYEIRAMRAPPLTKRELLSSRSPFPCVSESFVTRPRTRAINVSERSNGWYDVRRELPSPLPELRFIGLLRHDPPETRFVNSLVETRLTPGPADHLHSAPLPLTCFRFAIPRGFTSPAISRTRCLLFLWDVWNKLQDCINKDNNNIRGRESNWSKQKIRSGC